MDVGWLCIHVARWELKERSTFIGPQMAGTEYWLGNS